MKIAVPAKNRVHARGMPGMERHCRGSGKREVALKKETRLNATTQFCRLAAERNGPLPEMNGLGAKRNGFAETKNDSVANRHFTATEKMGLCTIKIGLAFGRNGPPKGRNGPSAKGNEYLSRLETKRSQSIRVSKGGNTSPSREKQKTPGEERYGPVENKINRGNICIRDGTETLARDRKIPAAQTGTHVHFRGDGTAIGIGSEWNKSTRRDLQNQRWYKNRISREFRTGINKNHRQMQKAVITIEYDPKEKVFLSKMNLEKLRQEKVIIGLAQKTILTDNKITVMEKQLDYEYIRKICDKKMSKPKNKTT